MERRAFIVRIPENRRKSIDDRLKSVCKSLLDAAERLGVGNFSVWGVADLLLCYGEESRDGAAGTLAAELMDALDGAGELLCAPGTMRLMYHDLGIVRADKSLIRHRVFCTRLKPGCEEEYKRRHDGLIEARGGKISEGPDSNFTIWYGAGYIFGYDEKVKSFDHEPTEAEKAADIAWETRQLEIMDWLTDDVDWISGERHEPIRRLV